MWMAVTCAAMRVGHNNVDRDLIVMMARMTNETGVMDYIRIAR